MAAIIQYDLLRRQRTIFTAIAITLLGATLAALLPPALTRRSRQKALARELTTLQKSIEAVHQQTRDVQSELVQTQAEIRSLLHEPPSR